MAYFVTLKKRVLKTLEDINEPNYSNIKKAIYGLADNPRPFGYIKLKDSEAYRIREGNYRIIYEINDKIITVTVVDVGHRKDIYK